MFLRVDVGCFGRTVVGLIRNMEPVMRECYWVHRDLVLAQGL